MNNKVLTRFQERVLYTLFDNGLGELDYYLTGGTALSEFYLQHRYSDDLDFFTRKQDTLKPDFDKFKEILTSHEIEITIDIMGEDFMRYFVQGEEQGIEPLKIEFAKDVTAMMAPSLIVGNIIIDSFEDIAVNKVCAIMGREPPEPKDFVDLFFILKESSYTLDYLVTRAREKEAYFENEEGVLIFATNLLAVDEFTFLPRMIKSLTLQDLKEDLRPRAREIIRRLRPRRG